MLGSRWRPRLSHLGVRSSLHSWLTEPASLTARCQASCSSFRVRLLRFAFANSLADEGGRSQLVKVREVQLECDGVPVIFAHTTLSTVAFSSSLQKQGGMQRGRLSRWMARLGSRSLGSLLFSHPGFVRGQIEFCRLDARHPLFRRIEGLDPAVKYLWARRSRHQMGAQTALVTEVFLPAIEHLQRRP